MTTEAEIGFGCILQRDAGGSPSVFTDIGEVIDPGSLSMSRDTVDATHTKSPNRWREFISALRDAGEVTTTIALVPGGAAYAALYDDMKSDEVKAYRHVFNDNANEALCTKWYFNAFVTSIETTTPIDDRMTVAVTLKITGEPSLSNG